MRRWIFFVCVVGMMACKHKKANLNSNAPVKLNDFVAAFGAIDHSFSANDSNLTTLSDTTRMSRKVLSKFIPDSVLASVVNDFDEGNETAVVFKPVGKIKKATEQYYLLNITSKHNTHLEVFVFDNKSNYLDHKFLLDNNISDDYATSIIINNEPTFTINREKITEDRQLKYTKVSWAYLGGSGFTVVVNESNEDESKNNAIANPIDTLPMKNVLSGNYINDNKNFISVRDGKNATEYLFFVHFEKKNGTCIGEMKGVMKMLDANNAVYNDSGDPCVIDFVFSNNKLSLKEKGKCGNRRGMNCFFDDEFTKKIISQPRKKKKK